MISASYGNMININACHGQFLVAHGLTGCDTVDKYCGIGKVITLKAIHNHNCKLNPLTVGHISIDTQ